MFTLTKETKPKSSREQIRLKGVKNDILILPDNKYRIILETSSINFELKSEDEQDAIIDNYQNFLNALPCSIQILFRVRAMDLDGYLDTFNESIKTKDKIQNEQLKNYKQFVKRLVSDSKILSRSFYIILPLDTDTTELEVVGQQLKLLEDIVRKGFDHIGIKTRKLSGLEILDLFYSFYNPEQSKTQSITSQTLDLINQAHI
jgi:hypothetical protein